MPGWLIEWFADETLTQLFWIISLAGAPFWALMIAAPRKKLTRHLCSPFVGPVILGAGLTYLYAQLWELGLPAAPSELDYSAGAAIAGHPIVLLIMWLHIQTLNLFLGESIFADAQRKRIAVPVELILCWALGPVGLLVYAARLVLTAPMRKN
ncbi:MAG: ABA4-like family protein [Puniceicoccales bacterium]